MGRKPQLHLNISQVNSTPLANPEASRKPAGKGHTYYIDFVSKLRNPTKAEPINKWMTTGRVVGRPVGVSSPKQKLAKPRQRESDVTAQDYKNFFEADMSGSLSGSMGGYVSGEEEMAKKVREDEEFFKALKEGTFKAAPKFEKSASYQKPVVERYPYPKEIYTKDRSNEEYLKHFASLKEDNK